MSKQDQQTVEEAKQLEEEIAKLKEFKGTEFAAGIADREQKVQKLKNKLPVQEAQEARDAAATLSALAELEEKRVFEKNRIDAKIQKTIDRSVEVVAGGVKEEKAPTK